jgi:hypothetical protein
MATLRRLAAYLVEHERVDGETFDALFEGRIDVPNGLAEWRPVAARPRPWDDIEIYHDGRHRRPTPIAAAPPETSPEPVPVPRPSPVPAVPAAAAAPAARRPSLRPAREGAGRKARGLGLGRRARRLAAAYLAVAESLIRPATEADPEG